MMKFIIIFGPPAVGKMSVGSELARLTGLKLFHNHMTIDLVLNFFEFGEPRFHKLVSEFRRRVFEEVAASDLPGLIFTFVWALDLESDRQFIERTCEIFREKEAQIYFVELEARVIGEAATKRDAIQTFSEASQARYREVQTAAVGR